MGGNFERFCLDFTTVLATFKQLYGLYGFWMIVWAFLLFKTFSLGNALMDTCWQSPKNEKCTFVGGLPTAYPPNLHLGSTAQVRAGSGKAKSKACEDFGGDPGPHMTTPSSSNIVFEIVATVTFRTVHRNQILEHWIISRLVAPSHIFFTP